MSCMDIYQDIKEYSWIQLDIFQIEMSIQNNKFCTLHDDKHFLLPCGGNSCKICLLEIKEKILKCFHCNKDFDRNDIIEEIRFRLVRYL